MQILPVTDAVIPEQSADSAAGYPVRTIEENEWSTWDGFVRQSPQGTLFHTTRWLQNTGVPFRIYGCYHDGALVGGMVVEIVGRQTAGHSHFTSSTEVGQSTDRTVGHAFSCPDLGVVLPPPTKKLRDNT